MAIWKSAVEGVEMNSSFWIKKKVFVTGRGIGLYISAQIIKAHNGKIWAESAGVGKGSTFNIELPIEQKEENKAL